jgi:Type II CAAX prenyl endopeptidase Rce1-like
MVSGLTDHSTARAGYYKVEVRDREHGKHCARLSSAAAFINVRMQRWSCLDAMRRRGILVDILPQTFLMQRTSGRVRFWKYEMHVAGVVLALLFALAHLTSFWTENLWIALGQQIYAFALGILYAYWREKSGSLLASIIGHNVSDAVEYVLMFLMTWCWR